MEANVLVKDAHIFNAAVNSSTISWEDSNKDEQRETGECSVVLSAFLVIKSEVRHVK